MHVAVVGAGALGRVYGTRLALLAGANVTFIVRHAREKPEPFILERVEERDDVLRLEAPTLALQIPGDADVVLVCVRGEQLDEKLVGLLDRGPKVPCLMLTPMLPGDYERLRAGLSERLVASMPGVVAYVRHDEVVRHWIPRAAPTLIDAQSPPSAVVEELVRLLGRAGLRAKVEEGVSTSNPATTVTFIPLAMAVDAAGTVAALMADHALVDLALEAAAEGQQLASRIGKVAGWASLLTRFVGRTTLRVGVAIAERQSPEAVRYVEEHFGHKLRAQNVAMAKMIVALAEQEGTPHVALAALRDRLEAR